MITVLESCLLQQGDLGGRAGNRGQVLDVVHATPGDLGTAGVGHVAAGIAVRLAGVIIFILLNLPLCLFCFYYGCFETAEHSAIVDH